MRKLTMTVLAALILVVPVLAVELSWDSGAMCGVHAAEDLFAYAVQFDEEKTGGAEGHVSEVRVFFKSRGGPITSNCVVFYVDDASRPGETIGVFNWNNRLEGWQCLVVDIDVPPVFYVSLDRAYYCESLLGWGVAFDDDGTTGHSWIALPYDKWGWYLYDSMIRCEWRSLRD